MYFLSSAAFLGITQVLFIYFINNELEPSILSFINTVTVFWDMFSQHFLLFITIYSGRKRFSRIIKYLRKINEVCNMSEFIYSVVLRTNDRKE